jgi:hypothetical protein
VIVRTPPTASTRSTSPVSRARGSGRRPHAVVGDLNGRELPDLDAAVTGLANSNDFRHVVIVASAASHLDQMEGCRPLRSA